MGNIKAQLKNIFPGKSYCEMNQAVVMPKIAAIKITKNKKYKLLKTTSDLKISESKLNCELPAENRW